MTNHLTPDLLAALREALAKATPGKLRPWCSMFGTHRDGRRWPERDQYQILAEFPTPDGPSSVSVASGMNDRDAAALAWSRNAVVELLASHDAMARELAALRATLEDKQHRIDKLASSYTKLSEEREGIEAGLREVCAAMPNDDFIFKQYGLWRSPQPDAQASAPTEEP